MKRWKPLTLYPVPVCFDFDKLRNACHFGFLGCRALLELSQCYYWCINMLKRSFEIPRGKNCYTKYTLPLGRYLPTAAVRGIGCKNSICPFIDISSVFSIARLIVCLWLVLVRAAEICTCGSWSKSLQNGTTKATNPYQTWLWWKDPDGYLVVCGAQRAKVRIIPGLILKHLTGSIRFSVGKACILHHCALGGTSLDTVVRTTCMNGLELRSSNIKYERHVHVAELMVSICPCQDSKMSKVTMVYVACIVGCWSGPAFSF